MARLSYGYRGGDLIAAVDVDGDFVPSTATYDVYTAVTGGSAVTDLEDVSGTPITQVTPDADGRVLFQGVDGYTGSYFLEDAADSGSTRWLVEPIDLSTRVSGVASVAVNGVDQGSAVDLVLSPSDITGLQDTLDAQDGQVDVAVTSAAASAQSADDAAVSAASAVQQVSSQQAVGAIFQNPDGSWPARITAGANVISVTWKAITDGTLLPSADNATYAHYPQDSVQRRKDGT